MIAVIGGTSCVGKTYLAHMLMKKYDVPYFPIDHLMMGLYRSNNECGFTPESPVEEISKVTWPIVYEMIKTNIENKNNYIYEGVQILPCYVSEINKEYSKDVVPIFLCLSEEYIKNNYENIITKRNVIENRTDGIDSIDKMAKKNNEIMTECEKYDIEPYIIDKNYHDEIVSIIKRIDLTIASTMTTRPVMILAN
jgi:putative acetyltransferase